MATSETQNLKTSSVNGSEENVYVKDAHMNSLHENYNVSTKNVIDTNPAEGYYTISHDENHTIDPNNIPYIIPGITESGMPLDPTTMQAAAALNQSLMYTNNAISTEYPQYHMYNGMNSMYGGIPQYYGGMNIPMNPYYDPYGIINPLACSNLSMEKTKKKTKKCYCC
ncbi:conserved Plasmodium protein, unknown function [Plasmodium sp. gorilla clade G2]|uniref:conserved Plasmodium protein, unknown function n=1 Tax=Plasmodium sp. gorilla clade G2 TaxID=880535 RepID=UPI000D21A7F3|nr:conserved Plasmodium protein, unknown function [Plasmodium sp. gorilla clade G2]SOV16014.1 conserved Plasmodium protein, unknown function [Plasmodium sp. gorilla clade G2]